MTHQPDTIFSAWQQIESNSLHMQASTGQADWKNMIESAKRRHDKIIGHFEKFPVNEENAAFYADAIPRFLTEGQELLKAIEMAKKNTLAENLLIRNQRQAARAYIS